VRIPIDDDLDVDSSDLSVRLRDAHATTRATVSK
jgi:hypothetical protein